MSKLQPDRILKMQVSAVEERGNWLEDEEGQRVFMPLRRIVDQPAKYQEILVGLYQDEKGRLRATMKLGSFVAERGVPAENIKRGDQITGMVYNVTPAGAFLVTPQWYIGHIPKVEMVGNLKPGQQVAGRVTFVREDGRFNLSMRPLKEVGRISDAERILEYLRKRNGSMPYSDESAPEIIKEKFAISKSAFKRAMGKLLKDGAVTQDKGWTYLNKE